MEFMKREIKKELIHQIPPTIDYEFQVSYNSYGHLVLRWTKTGEPDKDIVLVLSSGETNKLLGFLRSIRIDC